MRFLRLAIKGFKRYPIKSAKRNDTVCQLANDPGASLQGYTRKKLSSEHGDVFFCVMPLK